jgi:hypothetical protein
MVRRLRRLNPAALFLSLVLKVLQGITVTPGKALAQSTDHWRRQHRRRFSIMRLQDLPH